jgi:hypothetical protein
MDKRDFEGGETMIADELRVLFDDLKGEITLLRADVALINYDAMKIREQLDRIESNRQQVQQENIGLTPGTPPPDFLPPEMM